MELDKAVASLPSELRNILGELKYNCNAIAKPFRDKVYQRSAPELIYHYTDGEGLSGILESGKLWLTDLFDLNDPSELRYGMKYAQEALAEIANNPATEYFAKDFRALTAEGIQQVAHFFVCCFSCNGDELGQWRAYADDGRGFALAFDSASLVKTFESDNTVPGARGAFRLNYDGEELKKVQQQLVMLLPQCLAALRGRELTRPQVIAYMTTLSSLFSMGVIESAVLSKHKGYLSEDEYRLSNILRAGPRPDVLYRKRPYSLVRYIEFNWGKVASEALREIVIGPSADPPTSNQFAKACLNAYFPNPRKIVIRTSEIPYRSLRSTR